MAISPVTQTQISDVYSIPQGIDVGAYITMGNVMVNQWHDYGILAYTDAVIEQMQILLVCHLIQAYEPQTLKYAGMEIVQKGYGEFLKSTEYGQRILLYDLNGYLSGLGKRRARMWAL